MATPRQKPAATLELCVDGEPPVIDGAADFHGANAGLVAVTDVGVDSECPHSGVIHCKDRAARITAVSDTAKVEEPTVSDAFKLAAGVPLSLIHI